jgi:hypothetical protein
VKKFLGVEDFGAAAVRAAKLGESLAIGYSSEEAGRIARRDYDLTSRNWGARRDSLTKEYAETVKDMMYERDEQGNITYIRKQGFMRGFSDTDVSSVLERVVSSSNGIGDMKERINTVGKEALKTLEAFRDLFGSAQAAKTMLNQITGGQMSKFTDADFERLTASARGLQSIGAASGISHTALSGMLAVGMAGVQGAMGYSAADIAGGYVNTGIVTGIAQTFLANEIANSPSVGTDPVALQRLRARSTWRATQFAGSSAFKGITFMAYLRSKGQLSSEDEATLRKKFESGNREQMLSAVRMLGEIGFADAEYGTRQILDDTNFKIFSEEIAGDLDAETLIRDIGAVAASNEDRASVLRERADVNAGRNRNILKNSGIGQARIREVEDQARYESIVRDLQSNGESVVLQRMQLEYTKSGATAAVRKFDVLKSDLRHSGAVDTIELRAAQSASDALRSEIFDRRNSVDLSGHVEMMKLFGLDSEGDTNVSWANVVKAAKTAQRFVGQEDREKLQKFISSGDFSGLADELEGILANPGNSLDAMALKESFVPYRDNGAISNEGLAFVRDLSAFEVSHVVSAGSTVKGGVVSNEAAFAATEAIISEVARGIEPDETGNALDLSTASEFVRKNFMDYDENTGKYTWKKGAEEKYTEYKKKIDEAVANYRAVVSTKGYSAEDVAEARGKIASVLSGLKVSETEPVDYSSVDSAVRNIEVNGEKVEELANASSKDFLNAASGKSAVGTTIRAGVVGSDNVIEINLHDLAKAARSTTYVRQLGEMSDIQVVDLLNELGGIATDAVRTPESERTEEQREALDTIRSVWGEIQASSATIRTSSTEAGNAAATAAASGRIARTFGGDLVSAEYFNNTARNGATEEVVTSGNLEAVGRKTQERVDNAAENGAYETAQSTVLRGLTTNDWTSFYRFMLKAGTSDEQAKETIEKFKELFGFKEKAGGAEDETEFEETQEEAPGPEVEEAVASTEESAAVTTGAASGGGESQQTGSPLGKTESARNAPTGSGSDPISVTITNESVSALAAAIGEAL